MRTAKRNPVSIEWAHRLAAPLGGRRDLDLDGVGGSMLLVHRDRGEVKGADDWGMGKKRGSTTFVIKGR